ncbi:hypothetical protein BCD67_24380 [Oscillatoriales cyanobacterium USR001]|nr:hypothetical protein BCD67_24380 [Oscillatoriales cyanobacterium USR001]
MDRVIKTGAGWYFGWNPNATEFTGLVGGDDWAIELTEPELNDFCRLLGHLAQTMRSMAAELMNEEKIACEVESDLLWMQAEGYPEAYTIKLILNGGRRCEGSWQAAAVPGLVQGVATVYKNLPKS